MLSNSTTIGIIGYGRFGKLFATHLSKDFQVSVFSSQELADFDKQKTLEEVCGCDIVIPCVPISVFEETITAIKDLVTQETIVMDVCSVKEIPATIMKKHLNCQLLATHPLFGPDTAQDSFKGRKIVLCPLTIKDEPYQQIKKYLFSTGLEIIETTPSDHDTQIAKSLFLTHFVGRTLLKNKSAAQDIDTEGYNRLLKILSTVENDTEQLFHDMYAYNPQAQKILKQFMDSARTVEEELP